MLHCSVFCGFGFWLHGVCAFYCIGCWPLCCHLLVPPLCYNHAPTDLSPSCSHVLVYRACQLSFRLHCPLFGLYVTTAVWIIFFLMSWSLSSSCGHWCNWIEDVMLITHWSLIEYPYYSSLHHHYFLCLNNHVCGGNALCWQINYGTCASHLRGILLFPRTIMFMYFQPKREEKGEK